MFDFIVPVIMIAVVATIMAPVIEKRFGFRVPVFSDVRDWIASKLKKEDENK